MSLIEKALRKGQEAQKVADRATPRAYEPAEPARDAGVAARRSLGDPARRRQLDRDALRQDGLLAPLREERAISHQFRTIKRPLIRRAFEAGNAGQPAGRASARAIMVTSALPGDGKTFTSLNLALSMAMERDHSVILVDGDVPKPHISRIFAAENEPGLLDVLQDPHMTVESALLATDEPNLCILPVGRQSLQATELLASARMRGIIDELQALDPQGIVLLDSSPIMLTSEARVLSSLFGQVVMVVRAGGTPQQAVLDAMGVIGEGPEVNIVLNQALHVADGAYYGYGSYYGKETTEGSQP